ncbi:N-6 DNA methylase [uncultured Treponema sp.]|uniref:Eco57I restriction-modification methylase domain-containing protein n=1 Tax=uncultured Treponema sp. TaxID=162155 RepID=UPI002585E3EF|nr:N-6 DNA methylase [uncultured Treponema sp.]
MTNFRPIFENDWCGIETFLKDILSPVFGDYEQGYDVLTNEPEVREKAKNANITEIRHAATFDFFGSELKVFDITVGDNKKLENNKVGIQAIVRQYINQFEGALIIFHHQKVENQEWRFSYVEKRVNAKDSTSAKRYTYILGKHLPARTISDRFTYLEDHKDILTLKDLTDAFSVEVLTKQFYDELFNWYEWACENVTFPIGDTTKDKNGKYNVKQTKEKNELNLIRLITRLMFVWFIKQKDLIPLWVFDESELNKVLTEFKPESKKDGNYYNAVLQNLFFATLNKKIEERAFADDKSISKNKQFGVKNFYRDNKEKTFFKESNSQIIERFKTVPFLNGGLFECLDKLVDDKDNKKNIEVFTDGFSREPNWMAFIPNNLFWQKEDGEHEGVIHLLSRYNFTVEENSPSDVQVALDPELLGKVFENLLGTYNPETSETARKDSGSFYTPREIVSFMVDESIKDYLSKTVKNLTSENIQILFNDNVECYNSDNKAEIVNALKSMKILDPACGSGAFPMGALQRIVHLIQKCNGVTSDKNSLYSLKLDLIEKCLYGVDIQPIAVQICKLRFFICLICEQDKTDSISDNYGFNPLPNLETKFVAANSLIGMERKSQNDLFSDPDGKIEKKKLEIQEKRHEHFKAPTAEAKAKCREDDRKLRAELANLLEQNKMFAPKDAEQLAEWNPYDQNAVSPFFDAEWMFNTAEGFNIVIGNPPYIQLQKDSGKLANLYEAQNYKSFAKTGDIYCLFYEKGCNLLNSTGRLCFITSNKWMRAGYGEKLRDYFAKNVNPKLLVDFAGVKVFESATVDTNILLFEKGKNEGKTLSCTTTTLTKDGLSNLSDFVKQNSCDCSFTTKESWVILSPIEQSIKKKIESAGVPLKDWDISINYGIKTGFNDAFIISGEKREEILNNCKTKEERKKTDDLIRPILRGRDIKRYSYEYADLYLIATFPAKHYDIEKYPAVKDYLLSFGMERLEQTGKEHTIKGEKIKARKKTNNKWFETQDSISYWDEFNKPKMLWSETMRVHKHSNERFPRFSFDYNGFITDKTCFFAVGEKLEWIVCFLNSYVGQYLCSKYVSILDNGGYLMQKIYIEKIPLPSVPDKMLDLCKSQIKKATKEKENEIDLKIYNIYGFNNEEIKYLKSII